MLLSLKFTLPAMAYVFGLFTIFYFLPFSFTQKAWFKSITFVLYLLGVVVWVAVEVFDAEYFAYNSKRVTYAFLGYVRSSDEFLNQGVQLIFSHCFSVVFSFVLVGCSVAFYKKIIAFKKPVERSITSSIGFLFALSLLFLAARSSVGLKPIKIMDAYQVHNQQHASLALNSTFTFFRTFGKQGLKQKPQVNDKQFFKHQYKNNKKFEPKNIVIFILESFSYDYFIQDSALSLMPFLNSIKKQSIDFTSTYANGRRSMDAMPSVLASLPSLMPGAYISSQYNLNQISALPKVLSDKGYETAFFHGAKNGSMGFESFSRAAGINKYLGLNQCKNKTHYDGFWGVYDHHFLEFFNQELSKFQVPFCASFFSLSSHHPYALNDSLNQIFEKPSDELQIYKTLRYVDDALAQFFKKAATQHWFENTVFVFTADHCAPTNMKVSEVPAQFEYKIPFFIYDPSNLQPGQIDRITSQADIMPTLLDYLNFDVPFFAFGSSALDTNAMAFSAHFRSDYYVFFYKQYKLYFKENEQGFVLDFALDILSDQKNESPNVSAREVLFFQDYLSAYRNAIVLNNQTL